ncbi:MAG: histidine kinase [Candidatus Aminicenantes bacterium]|nr:histidine kinase [Candidatus Aminicenantes bacterium]
MMEDLSLHILDIAENSIEAKARRVAIRVEELISKDRLVLEISDDGRGMSPRKLARALDPFFTTKKAKRIGLGLPLLAQAARAAGGKVTLRSGPGRGTRVRATFRLGHIDLQPLGDIAETLTVLMVAHPDVNFRYTHKTDAGSYVFRSHSSGAPARPRNIAEIKKDIRSGIVRIRRKS